MAENNNADNCDGAMWYVETVKNDDEIVHEVATTVYHYDDRKVEPTEIGYKYHILTYKDNKSDIEVYNAYIGDVSHFIKNNSKAGCHGLIVKAGVMETKSVKYMFKRILENFNFPQKSITDAVQLVR
jgi:hypothetical protein